MNGNKYLFNWWTPDVSIWMDYATSDDVNKPVPIEVRYPPGLGSDGRFSIKLRRKELQKASKEFVYMLNNMEIAKGDAEQMNNMWLGQYVEDNQLNNHSRREEAYF